MRDKKEKYHFKNLSWLIVVTAILANIHIASGQAKKEQQVLIPEDINKIFQTSCMPCHGSKGGRLPGARLNFSRWAGYGAAKEKEKASLICSAVRKGSMPPRSARESKPELIPTKGQSDMICKWAESLKPLKKEEKK
jgi:mono/diheme cytochrome c family protein